MVNVLDDFVKSFIEEHDQWHRDSLAKIQMSIDEVRRVLNDLMDGDADNGGDNPSLEKLGQIVLETSLEKLSNELQEVGYISRFF